MSHSTRLVGLEFEVCGQDDYHGERAISGFYDWECKDDGSIPEAPRTGGCDCDRTPLCERCDRPQGECECCTCNISCPDCGYTWEISSWQWERENSMTDDSEDIPCPHSHYARRCKGTIKVSLLEKKEKECTCSEDFCGRSYTPDCECEDYFDGYELVSPPGAGESFFNDAATIYNRIIEYSKETNHNFRAVDGDCATGYHVHCDASDLTLNHIAMLTVWFQEHSEQISRRFPDAVPLWRTDFYYCREIHYSRDWDQSRFIDQAINRYERYQMVNLQSYEKHGTVEFRIGYMPSSAEAMVEWAKYCQFLTDCAASVPLESFKDLEMGDLIRVMQDAIDLALAPAELEQIAA